jgi:adenylate kinase
MRLLIMGPQGAGKGTQAALLAENLSLPPVSTGDILRANVALGTELGLQAQEFMSRGELVPDDLTNQMIAARLAEPDAERCWLLDGYPRNVLQAKWLDELLTERGTKVTAVIFLNAPDPVVLKRMLLRGRADDTEQAINTRLALYRSETLPVLEFYGPLVCEVDGVGHLQEVQHRILAAIGRSDLVHA